MPEVDWTGPKNAGMTKIDVSPDGVAWAVIPEVRNFSFTPEKPFKEYASSSTNGRKRKRAGQGDEFDGSMDVYNDDGEPLDGASMGIKSGEEIYFRVREPLTDGTENDGSPGTGKRTWVLPVYIDDVDYEYDIEGDELLGTTVNFSQNGDITYPS